MKETMKKITMLFVAAAALLGVTSCNTAAIDEVTLGKTTVTASFADSRTALDGVKTLWSAEDKIEVNGVEFILTQGAGEATATFASNTPLAAAELYTAKYPAGVSAIPTTQKAVAGSFDPQAALAEASGVSADNLLFEHRHALLKLALAAPASKVEVLGYTLEGALEAEKVYYIAVAAENYEGLTAKVDGVEVRSSYNTVALENGQILNLGTLPNAAAEAVGIRTAADLVAFAAEVAAQIEAEQTPDGGKFKDANGVVNILANIDMKGVAWTPISNFAGTLEGNNHTIDNLVVEDATHAAMFKNLSGATIQNLVFGKGCSFTITGTSTSYAGAVVGQILTSATLKNIKTYATITGGTYMGGICGAADKKGGKILFEDCVNSGNVVYPAVPAYANITIGGICGQSEVNVTFNSCHNSGSVSNLSTGDYKYNKVGGIAGGASDAVMTNCTNTGTCSIDVRKSSEIWLGGLVGCLYRAINVSNCSNSGTLQISDKVTLYASQPYSVGGCFGRVQGDSDNANYWKIYKVSNTSSFTCPISGSTPIYEEKTNKDGSVSKYSVCNVHVGGITGYLTLRDAKLEECLNSGAITVKATGGNLIKLAGIVGYVDPDQKSTIGGGLIYKCENTGAITFDHKDNSAWCHVAGIVGGNDKNSSECNIDGCINRGNVTMTSYSKSNPAGIISQAQCNVKNCVNYGTICTTDAHKDYFSGTAGIVSRLNLAGVVCSNCVNYGTIIYQGKGFKNANTKKGIVGQAGVVGLCNYGSVENCENYGTILGNNYDASLGGAEYKNAQGSIVGWGAYNAAVTIKNCKVGGALGSCVEADEDFGAAKATAITADNYAGYIYGGDAGNGVTVTDCAFAQSK